jgi:hypothetical protein
MCKYIAKKEKLRTGFLSLNMSNTICPIDSGDLEDGAGRELIKPTGE